MRDPSDSNFPEGRDNQDLKKQFHHSRLTSQHQSVSLAGLVSHVSRINQLFLKNKIVSLGLGEFLQVQSLQAKSLHTVEVMKWRFSSFDFGSLALFCIQILSDLLKMYGLHPYYGVRVSMCQQTKAGNHLENQHWPQESRKYSNINIYVVICCHYCVFLIEQCQNIHISIVPSTSTITMSKITTSSIWPPPPP